MLLTDELGVPNSAVLRARSLLFSREAKPRLILLSSSCFLLLNAAREADRVASPRTCRRSRDNHFRYLGKRARETRHTPIKLRRRMMTFKSRYQRFFSLVALCFVSNDRRYRKRHISHCSSRDSFRFVY